MALANLNINVTANTNTSIESLLQVKAAAASSMAESAKAVSDFQKSFAKDQEAVSAQAKAISNDLGISSQKVSQEMDKATENVKEFVGTRIAIAAVGVALGAVAAAAVAAGYAIYKTTGFIEGLFTGESMKSKNVDALIAIDAKVLELQKDLQMTTQDAEAMMDALDRLGVNKTDITGVYSKLETVLHGNTDELDRLGVAYEDVNGKQLSNAEIVQNAVKVLGEYTSGWDRQQAAVAIGLGSYEQLTNYLKVNQKEIQNSKDRLNEYNLMIGPETQKYVDEYQKTMREFDHELKLMGDGMARVWADQVMPAFITWANAFKEGWPSIVNGTRHVIAAFTSLGYGLKEVFDIAYDVLEGLFKGIGGGFAAIAAAAEAALKGNFAGAKDVLVAGWNDTRAQIAGIGDKITQDSQKNLKAIQLAQGLLNKDMTAAGVPGSAKKGGKPWEPPETAVDDSAWQKAVDESHVKYLEYSKAFDARMMANQKETAALQLEQLKTDYDRGLVATQEYYDKRKELQLRANDEELKIAAQRVHDLGVEALNAMNTDYTVKDSAGNESTISGESSAAYYDALAKVEYAKRELQKLLSDRAKIETQSQNEMYQATQQEREQIQAERADVLALAGDFDDAEKIKQDAFKKTAEYLRLVAADLQYESDIEIKNAVASAQAQNHRAEAIRAFAIETLNLKDALGGMIGLNQSLLKYETDYTNGLQAQAVLEERLKVAIAARNNIAIAALNKQIELQTKLNEKIKEELDFQQQVKVLTGEIVGFNGDVAIYRDDWEKVQNTYKSAADAAKGMTDAIRTQNGELLSSVDAVSRLSSGLHGVIGVFTELKNVMSVEMPETGMSGYVGSSGSMAWVGAEASFFDQLKKAMYYKTWGRMPSYDVGTDYVPYDQVALVHKGEKIIPAGQNTGGVNIYGGLNVTLPNITHSDDYLGMARGIYAEMQKLGRLHL